jgi:hypothetical protein
MKADDAFTGSVQSEQEIRDTRRKIQPKINGLEKFEHEMLNTIRLRFQEWTAVETLIIERQEEKVAELSKLRSGLDQALEQIKSTLADIDDLNAKLLAQNLKNAMGIIVQRVKQLKDRAITVQELFAKIKKAGEDMDGNHTDDEVDFVEALKEEMPTVEKELVICFAKIEECNGLLNQLKRDQSMQTMNKLK